MIKNHLKCFLDKLILTAPILMLAITSNSYASNFLDKVYEVKKISNITYGTGKIKESCISDAIQDLKMDLYLPKGDSGKRPVAIFIHGGAFKSGSKSDGWVVDAAADAASRGYAAASIDYRLRGDCPEPSARMQPIVDMAINQGVYTEYNRGAISALDDSLKALEFINTNAGKVRADTSKVIIWGGSAGAATALHLAYELNEVGIERPNINAIVSLAGDDGLSDIIKLDSGKTTTLSYDEPALLQVHGTSDKTVSFELASDLHNEAKLASLPAAHLYVGKNKGHGASNFLFDQTISGEVLIDKIFEFSYITLFSPGSIDPSHCEVMYSDNSDCSPYLNP